MQARKDDYLADAIHAAFISPNESDANFEAANIVDALFVVGRSIANELRKLGNADAATPMGAIEAHGQALLDAASTIAGARHAPDRAESRLSALVRWCFYQ